MTQTRHAGRGERGAVFVQVGIAAFVLVSFNVFVLDYGMMWVARRQAQNAADAGALAGAVARGYDDFSDPPAYAMQVAQQVAATNPVWQASPTAVSSDACPAGVSAKCIRVDVYRNGQAGSTPLPTLFGPMLGITDQGVRATATAVAGRANATKCMKPWALSDDWIENLGSSTTFDYWNATGTAPLAGADGYIVPNATSEGLTTISNDYNERIIWDLEDPLTAPITRNFVIPLHLPGTNSYAQNMVTCNGNAVAIGDTVPVETTVIGTSQTTTAANAVFALDAAATYDYATQRIGNSCAPVCAPVSPRLLAVVLYDPVRFQKGRNSGVWDTPDVGCPSNSPCVTVRNIVGLFMHGISGGYGPHGHFVKYPGYVSGSAPLYTENASWLVRTHLIR